VAAIFSQNKVRLFAVVELIHKHQALLGADIAHGLEIHDIGRRHRGFLYQPVAHVHGRMPLVTKPDVCLALGAPAGVFVGRVFPHHRVIEGGFAVFDGPISLFPKSGLGDNGRSVNKMEHIAEQAALFQFSVNRVKYSSQSLRSNPSAQFTEVSVVRSVRGQGKAAEPVDSDILSDRFLHLPVRVVLPELNQQGFESFLDINAGLPHIAV